MKIKSSYNFTCGPLWAALVNSNNQHRFRAVTRNASTNLSVFHWTRGLISTLALGLLPLHAAVQFEFSKQVVQESDGRVAVHVVRVNDSLLAPFTVDFATVDQ